MDIIYIYGHNIYIYLDMYSCIPFFAEDDQTWVDYIGPGWPSCSCECRSKSLRALAISETVNYGYTRFWRFLRRDINVNPGHLWVEESISPWKGGRVCVRDSWLCFIVGVSFMKAWRIYKIDACPFTGDTQSMLTAEVFWKCIFTLSAYVKAVAVAMKSLQVKDHCAESSGEIEVAWSGVVQCSEFTSSCCCFNSMDFAFVQFTVGLVILRRCRVCSLDRWMNIHDCRACVTCSGRHLPGLPPSCSWTPVAAASMTSVVWTQTMCRIGYDSVANLSVGPNGHRGWAKNGSHCC